MLLSLFILCQANSVYLTLGICGLFSLLFILYLPFNKKFKTATLPTVFVSVVAVCFILTAYDYFVYNPYVKISSKDRTETVTITDFPYASGDKYYCLGKFTSEENGKTYKVRLSLNSASKYDFDYEEKINALEPGDKLTFKGYYYLIGGDNKAISQNFKSRGLFLGAYPKGKLSVEKANSRSLGYYLKREKVRTINLLLSSFDRNTASIGIGVLLGDKSVLDSDTFLTIRNSGISHILAVSGLHLTVWIMFILNILESLGLNKRRWAIFLLGFDLLIMFFASFSGSVVRAGIMMGVYLLSVILKEQADSLNSLGLSAVILLTVNPFAALNISYLLSFVACFSIISAALPIISKGEAYIKTRWKSPYAIKILSSLFSSVVISVVVAIYTFPVISYYFGTLSVFSVLTNLLIMPISTLLILSFGLYVMFWFVPVLSRVLSACAELCTKYLLWASNLTGSSDISVVSVKTESVSLLLFLSVVLFILPYAYKKFKKKKDNLKRLKS